MLRQLSGHVFSNVSFSPEAETVKVPYVPYLKSELDYKMLFGGPVLVPMDIRENSCGIFDIFPD